MKRIIILFFSILFLVTFCLSAGTRVKISKQTGHWLTVDKGSRSGVKVNMRGKVLRMLVESGKKIPFTLGIFVVKKTTEENAELYIEKAAKNIDLDSAEIVEFDDTLKSKPAPGEQFRGLKTRGLSCLKQKQFEKARKLLKQAGKLKPGDKEIATLLEGLDLLGSPEISISDYIVFKATYPGSPLLSDLEKKLRKHEPHLPPDPYLISDRFAKNSKGYYEVSMKNGHLMIYIPQLKLFVDKYEVSNFLYLPFAEVNEIIPEIIKFSKYKNYPYCCEDHPAIVRYKEAEAYCLSKDMRLPTEEEWEIIAGKNSGFKYGCGDSIKTDSDEYAANYESLDDGYEEIAPVKSYEKFSSTFGAVNMLGNVYEWVQGQSCKGGGFLSEKEELAITHRSVDEIYVGFRCVMEAAK